MSPIFLSALIALSPLTFPAPETKPVGVFVGELQEKWQFPSDHMPIGMTIDGIHIASWNVLNAAYMDWVIEKNSQGLSRSLIAKEHVYLDWTELTYRDLHVIDLIKSMLIHPTHPRSLIALQECSAPFITELKKQLPENYGVVLSDIPDAKDQNIVIYDTEILSFDKENSFIVNNIFNLEPDRNIMDLSFYLDGKGLHIINAHLPGKPGNPAPYEFAAYACSQTFPGQTTIALGDMNFNEAIMEKAFLENAQGGFYYKRISPYCTNISPANLFSKSIDHFFILSMQEHELTANTPEEVMEDLQDTVDLIQPSMTIL